MGIAERKERERQEMRQRILDTAMRQLIQDGYDKLSLRKVAKEMEYSPGTLYLHFKNKDDIYYELHDHCFNMLFEALNASSDIEDPLERMSAMGRAYITFGLNNPEIYNLMFIIQSPMEMIEDEESWECAKNTFTLLVQNVQACIDAGYFPNKNTMLLSMIAYSSAHGMVSMELHRHMKMFPEEVRETLINDSMNHLIEMLQKP